MKYHDEKERIVMDDGTEYYTCLQTIGLSPDNKIHEGYDGTVEPLPENIKEPTEDEEYEQLWSIPDRHKIEIAEFMIKRWSVFLKELKGGTYEVLAEPV